MKKDFAEIEREAEMADQVRSRMEEERREAVKKTVEDEAKAAANMRLAYQEMSLTQKKTVGRYYLIDVCLNFLAKVFGFTNARMIQVTLAVMPMERAAD